MKEEDYCEKYGIDLEYDLEPDPDSLDIEWLNQPELMRERSELAAEAALMRDQKKVQMDRAKDKLDKVKAQVAMEVRESPGDFGVEKITDKVVETVVLLDERIETAKEDYYRIVGEFNEYKHMTSYLYSQVSAAENKKASLEQLVRLLSLGYWAAPTEPKDISRNQTMKDAKRRAYVEKVKGSRRKK